MALERASQEKEKLVRAKKGKRNPAKRSLRKEGPQGKEGNMVCGERGRGISRS